MSVQDPKIDLDIIMSNSEEKRDLEDRTEKNLNLLSNKMINNSNKNSNSDKNEHVNHEISCKSDSLLNGENIVQVGEPLKNPLKAKELMLLSSEELNDSISEDANSKEYTASGQTTTCVDNLNDTITDVTLSIPTNMEVVTCSIAPTEKQTHNDLVKSTISIKGIYI